MITLKQNYFHKCLIQSSPFRWFLYQLFFFSLPRYWIGFLFHKHLSSINCRNFYEGGKVPVNEIVKKTIELVRIKGVKSLLLYHLVRKIFQNWSPAKINVTQFCKIFFQLKFMLTKFQNWPSTKIYGCEIINKFSNFQIFHHILK